MSFLPSLGPSSECIPYPVSVSGHLSSGSEEGSAHSLLTRGCLSSYGAALLHRGPCLEVMSISQNERASSETFPDEITCLDSLGPDQVVVGLNSGIVSVLDIKISKLIKSISFQERISSLAVIHDSASRSLAEELMFFKGILAVGTQSGDLYLLDLALDKAQEDGEPLAPMFISPGLTTELADLRQSTQNHLCIHLNDAATGKENKGLVISALAHLPQLGCVAVGYNSGSWKLWNLNRLNTEFTFAPGMQLLPCVGFAFQEPENDPRNHSYLWVMRSQNDVDTEDDKKALNTFATIDLYALRYENKDEVDQYGVLYSGLTSCSKSFGFTLTGDPEDHRRAKGSLGLTTRTLGTLSSTRQAQLDISGTECDSIYTQGLCIFMWEVRTYDDPRSKYFLGVFDLNMWYQDQMPLEYMGEDVCPFLSYCSMEDALASCPDANILDVHVDLASISRCKSSILSEKNSYPSSLAFEMIAILNCGFVQTSHLGLQKKVLLELQTEGHTSLVEPYNLYKLCCIAGFINETNLCGKLEQRSALLTVALEHNLVNLLTGCVSYWNDGKYSDEGCTMKALLDWAWQRIISIKQMIDKVTAPLFDLSSLHFNENNQITLIQNSQQLHHLSAVIQELITQSVVASQIGFEELQIKMNVVRLVNLYVRVVLWFFSAGLLPELPEPESGSIPLLGRDSPYPYSELSVMYKNKRRQIKDLHSTWGYSDVPLLLIDGLCSQFGSKLSSNFERDGGDGLYPPPTLFSILSAYLIDDHRSSQINDVGKHRLIHYLFLDMADKRCNDEIWSDMIDRLIQFPSAFSVPPSIIKLTQAFWLLDQGDFEEAMGMLLDPLILDKDIKSWEHRAIIVAFLVQDQPKSALKYSRIRKPPVRDAFDIKLHVSVLLSTGNVHEAFQFQRNRRNTCKDLLNYFFVQAEKLGKLNLLFELTLTNFEETEFVNFLQNSESSSEVLLMYYLQRYRFQEALTYHRLLKQKNLSTPTHQALMNRYSNLLPNLLVENKGYETLKVSSSSKMPVPLSREIKTTNFNPLFHTSIIEEQLENSLGPISSSAVFTPFRPRGQRINPVEKRKFVEVSKPKRDPNEEDDLIVQTPPLKKSRFIETKTLVEEKSSSPSRSLPPAFTEEVNSILCTPTIKRSDVKRLRKNTLDKGEDFEPGSPFGVLEPKKLTPSILKSADTPPLRSLKAQEDSTSKSLRFNMPKKLPPPELKPVNLMDVASEESGEDNVEVISVGSSSVAQDESPLCSMDNSPSKSLSLASRKESPSPSFKMGQSFFPSPLSNKSSSNCRVLTETNKKTPSVKPSQETYKSSKLVTPRKPISAYLEDSNESLLCSSVETPKLSLSASKRIQSQLSESMKPKAIELEDSSDEEDQRLMMSEEDSVHDDNPSVLKESENAVEDMIKNRALADAEKFIGKGKDGLKKKAFQHGSPLNFKTNTPKQETPLNFDNLIKKRATVDFNQFMESHSSSTNSIITQTTRSSKTISSSATATEPEHKFLQAVKSISSCNDARDLSEIIKEQASSDFGSVRKVAESKTVIYLENEEKSDEEVTPDKIKAKALKSAEDWVKKSPYIGPVSKKLAIRDPIHSETADDATDIDTMIKCAAEKDFDSLQKEEGLTKSDAKVMSPSPSKVVVAPPLKPTSSTPFQFSMMDDESSDSDVLNDEEDEYPIEEYGNKSEASDEPMVVEVKKDDLSSIKFDFAQPVLYDDERDEDIIFNFSRGKPLESTSIGDEEEATNEFDNVKFTFTEELSSVQDEASSKIKFSFSEPKEDVDSKIDLSFSEPKEDVDSKIDLSFSEPKEDVDSAMEEEVAKEKGELIKSLHEAPKAVVEEEKPASAVVEEKEPKNTNEDSPKPSPAIGTEKTKGGNRRSKRISQLGGDKSTPLLEDTNSSEKKEEKPKVQDKSSSKVEENSPRKSFSPQKTEAKSSEVEIGVSKRSLRKFSLIKEGSTPAKVQKPSEEVKKTTSTKSEDFSNVDAEPAPADSKSVKSFTPRKLRSSASEERELSTIKTPLKSKDVASSLKPVSEKKTRVSTPRRHRTSLSEEKELPSQPRRSKRLSHSSVVPVLSRVSMQDVEDSKKDLGVESSDRLMNTSSASEGAKEPEEEANTTAASSKLNVIQEEDESKVESSEAPSTPKRSLRAKKPLSRQGVLSLEKVMEEEEEEALPQETSKVATPVRKSKRLSAKSATYDETKKSSTKGSKRDSRGSQNLSETSSTELMYANEEPFDVFNLSEEEKSSSSPTKSDKKSSTRRKKYVVKKKVVSQKVFF